MSTYSLTVQPRTLVGRKVKGLRSQNLIPGNIYGQGLESKIVQISRLKLLHTYREVGYTGLIELEVEGEKAKLPVLITRIQQDPITEYPVHVDFRKVNLKQKLTATVPIEFIGESLAVKEGGVFSSLITELEVEAFPQDFPESLQVDISTLVEINDHLTIADLKFDHTKLTIELEPDTVIAKVESQKVQEESTPVPTEEAQPAAAPEADTPEKE